MEFKVGDVVRLLSGGCKMTVVNVHHNSVVVVYHDLVGNSHNLSYINQALYKVSPGDE